MILIVFLFVFVLCYWAAFGEYEHVLAITRKNIWHNLAIWLLVSGLFFVMAWAVSLLPDPELVALAMGLIVLAVIAFFIFVICCTISVWRKARMDTPHNKTLY